MKERRCQITQAWEFCVNVSHPAAILGHDCMIYELRSRYVELVLEAIDCFEAGCHGLLGRYALGQLWQATASRCNVLEM